MVFNVFRCVRANTTPSSLITAFIIFTIVLLGGITWMTALNDDKGSGFINDVRFKDFNKTFNKFSDIDTSTKALESGLTGAEPKKGLFGVLDSLIDVAWGSLRGLFSSFSFLTTAWSGLSVVFGLPSWVVTLVSALVIVALVFSIYSLIMSGRT